jgi:hypothetical protein
MILCAVYRLIVVLFCVMCVICLLCRIVLPLQPGKTPFAFKINNNKETLHHDQVGIPCGDILNYPETLKKWNECVKSEQDSLARHEVKKIISRQIHIPGIPCKIGQYFQNSIEVSYSMRDKMFAVTRARAVSPTFIKTFFP